MLSRKQAEGIALRHVLGHTARVDWDYQRPWAPRAVERPPRLCAYDAPDEPAWYVFAPWLDGQLAIRSSRIVVIAKADGRVVYDGSANDEG